MACLTKSSQQKFINLLDFVTEMVNYKCYRKSAVHYALSRRSCSGVRVGSDFLNLLKEIDYSKVTQAFKTMHMQKAGKCVIIPLNTPMQKFLFSVSIYIEHIVFFCQVEIIS